MDNLTETIRQVSTHSGLFPLAICSLQIARGKFGNLVKWIMLIVAFSVFSEHISIIIGKRFGNNMPWFHTYVFVETILILMFLKSIYRHKKKVIVILGPTLLIFIPVYTALFADVYSFNTTARIIQSLTLIILCLTFFYQLIQHENEIFIDRYAVFWCVVALLIYFSGSFFSFLLHQTILDKRQSSIWIYHNVANTAKHLIFGLSFIFFKE